MKAKIFGVTVERVSGVKARRLFPDPVAYPSVQRDCDSASRRLELYSGVEGVIRTLARDGDQVAARALLSLKRNIFNERAPKKSDWEALRHLHGRLRENLHRELANLDLAKTLHDSRDQWYEKRLDETFRNVERIAALPKARTALMMSAEGTHRLAEPNSLQGKRRKPGDLKRARLTLLTYATRAACKTTPFSYFGSYSVCVDNVDVDSNVSSFIRISPTLARKIAWTAILYYRPLQNRLTYSLAGSFALVDGEVRWAAPIASLRDLPLWTGWPHAMKSPLSPEVDRLRHLFERGGSFDFSKVREVLNGKAASLTRFLQVGVLEPEGIPGYQEPVLGWINGKLPEGDPLKQHIATLADIDSDAMQAATPAGVNATVEAVRSATAAISALIADCPVSHRRAPLVHMTRTRACPTASVSDFSDDLAHLGTLLQLSSRQDPASKLAEFFLRNHGISGRVPAMTFFNSAATLGAAEAIRPAARSPDLVDFLSRHSGSHQDGVTHIDPDAIHDVYAALPDALRNRAAAFSMQAQHVARAEIPHLVINKALPGSLHLTARYLENPHQIDLARDFLRDTHPNGRLVALPAGIIIDAARTPAILAEEISIPGVPANRGDTQKIDLTQMDVGYDVREHRIILLDAAAQVVIPLLLGAISPSSVPPIVRAILATRAQFGTLIYSAAWEALNISASLPFRQAQSVLPEVRVGTVIVVRETSLYNIGDLPAYRDQRSFFDDMLDFIDSRNLPRRAFIRLHYSPVVVGDGGSPSLSVLPNNVRADLAAKPMFFDFAEPASAALFWHLLRKRPLRLSFQAADPDPLATLDNATEVQFDMMLKASSC